MAAYSPLRNLVRLKGIVLGKPVHLDAAISGLYFTGLPHCKAASNTGLIFHPISRPYSSEVLLKSDVTVDYRDGLPVVALPLPSRREACEFTLKPISQTVGDFTKFIKEEDGGVDTVTFYSNEGSRIAKSTTIDVLMRSNFQIRINDDSFEVSPPVICPVPQEDSQTLQDVKQLVAKLYSSMHVESYQLNREKELIARLEDLKEQISPLEKTQLDIKERASINTHRLSWLGLGAMGLQFGILARLTWWEYSWDIMEPVTYFVTYGTSIAMFAYFLLTRQEYKYNGAKDRQFVLKFHQLAQKEKFDVEKFNSLKNSIADVEYDLRRLRDPLQRNLPLIELEKFPKKN